MIGNLAKKMHVVIGGLSAVVGAAAGVALYDEMNEPPLKITYIAPESPLPMDRYIASLREEGRIAGTKDLGFTDATWNDTLRKCDAVSEHFGYVANKDSHDYWDIRVVDKVAACLTRDNAHEMHRQTGEWPTYGQLRVAHAKGATGAARLIEESKREGGEASVAADEVNLVLRSYKGPAATYQPGD
jgi:hypothetical protein